MRIQTILRSAIIWGQGFAITLAFNGAGIGIAGAATSQNNQSPLGINLAAVSYYSSEMPFINIFVTAGQWITHSNSAWDTGEEQYLNLDANGWPKSLTTVNDPSAQKFNSIGVLLNRFQATPNGYYPGGQYVVLYDGQGTLSYGFDAQLVSHAPGRDVISVAPSAGGIELNITATDPNHTGDYIRNIRVLQATYETAFDAGATFNPVFLNLIEKFRVLRFMDWFKTNGSTLSSWANRSLPTNAFWGAFGVPIEIAVQLANTIGADAWLNVPAMADDNYITQMATLVHNSLGASQKVYVEFSNEVWNGVFSQYHYAVAQGQALWPSQPGGGGGYEWNRNWYGMRTAQTCDLWKAAWGTDANRVVCVLGAQAATTYSATDALKCAYWSGAPCANHHIDAVAVAPYFGYQGVPSTWTSQADGGVTSLFASLYSQNDPSVPAGGDLNQSAGWEAAYIAALAPYKLPLVGYEGGQSFADGSTPALNTLYETANRDPRMGAAYTGFLNQWKSSGGQVLILFNDASASTQYGSWGAIESLMQTTSPLSAAPPKWQAIQNFISGNVCWWTGCVSSITTAAPPAIPAPPASLQVH